MFGPAQANTLSAKIHRNTCISWRFRIRPHMHAAGVIGPLHHGRKGARHFRLDRVHRAAIYLTAGTINGDHITSGQFMIMHKDLAASLVKSQVTCT